MIVQQPRACLQNGNAANVRTRANPEDLRPLCRLEDWRTASIALGHTDGEHRAVQDKEPARRWQFWPWPLLCGWLRRQSTVRNSIDRIFLANQELQLA